MEKQNNGLIGFHLDHFIKDDMQIRTKSKGGEVLLNLKDVAIGLNITKAAASGNEVVRWIRVKEYLTEIDPNTNIPNGNDFDLEDLYIYEWVFYMLCMKARNEKAKKFQLWIAKEILPNIRKFGAYIAPDLLDKFVFTQEELATGKNPIELVMRQAIASREKVIEYRDKYYDAQDKKNEVESDMSSMKQLIMGMWRTLMLVYVVEGNRDKTTLNDLTTLGKEVIAKYPQVEGIFEELSIIEETNKKEEEK